MRRIENRIEDLKIAYIGGGSRGWAWGLMKDLEMTDDISGHINLYDIDKKAAMDNELIGNGNCRKFTYKAVDSLHEALKEAEFVIISILPGTFDEMQSDVHTPEKYGIYQSVGDTTGPGGILRAMRTIPMYVEFAEAIRMYCPDAWVINYTNPMAICVATLYRVFPEIKAFGCCHEVFGTQNILCKVLKEKGYVDEVCRQDLVTTPVGINHFTWITKAYYKNIDIFPIYKEYVAEHRETGIIPENLNWSNKWFKSHEKVKFSLFEQFGAIAAAGDRHLVEFCPGNWFLKDEETVEKWGYGLTSVDFRRNQLKKRLDQSVKYVSGEDKFTFDNPSDEEGVRQIRALLGLESFVTNVNLPNMGQIPNIPLGVIVETNAVFSGDSVMPQYSGEVPQPILNIMGPAINNQKIVLESTIRKDINGVFSAFVTDRLCDRIHYNDLRKLFNEMVLNTKSYLSGWELLK